MFPGYFGGLASRFFSSVFAHGLSEWCLVIPFHWGDVSSVLHARRAIVSILCLSLRCLQAILGSGGPFFLSTYAQGLSEWCVVIHFHWGMCIWGCMLVQQPHGCTPCLWEGIPSVGAFPGYFGFS